MVIKYYKQIIITISLILLVFIVRFISFQDFILNIDETEWLYCLMRFKQNPIPFIGYEPHTSGPLSTFILSPLLNFKSFPSVVDLRIYGIIFTVLFTFILFFKFTKNIKLYSFLVVFSCCLLIGNKDFLAYNTEWICLPFIFLGYFLFEKLKEEKNTKILFVFSFVLIILPFIKFQTFLFVLFFYSCFIFILLKNKDYSIFGKFLIINTFILSFFVLLFHFFVGIDNFYYLYLQRNFLYASTFSNKPVIVITIEFVYLFIQLYLPFLIILLSIVILLLTKINFKSIFELIKFELLFFLVSIVTIIIPKNNFEHYYQFLFVSFTILFVKLFALLNNKKEVKIFLFLIIAISLAPFVNRANDNFYNKIIRGNSLNYLSFHKSKEINVNVVKNLIKPNSKVIVLGWHYALPIYYRLRHKVLFVSPSGHTTFLLAFKNNKNVFDRELKDLIPLLKGKVDYVIDAESILSQINDKRLNLIISNYYEAIKMKNNVIIYKLRKNENN
jgi:hypothetical protein